MANNNNRKLSREQAGQKGGNKTADNHDQEFFEEIGQKGGRATSKNHDQDFYEEIGRKGGKRSNGGQGKNNS
ncbi:KGG domain-containing protein [Oceanobacillus massiliensis]|uniref:KGG domain-containing protein n=1 Tax=Oceanobacillus massiliensis TaxID=1465765 RepID=UPI000287D6E8|nr:general stress protein [Oceanobacillus massiliensis]